MSTQIDGTNSKVNQCLDQVTNSSYRRSIFRSSNDTSTNLTDLTKWHKEQAETQGKQRSLEAGKRLERCERDGWQFLLNRLRKSESSRIKGYVRIEESCAKKAMGRREGGGHLLTYSNCRARSMNRSKSRWLQLLPLVNWQSWRTRARLRR